MTVAPYTMAQAEQAHVENKHKQHGFADDWMECGTPRCMNARLMLGLDLPDCPTCGGGLSTRGKWLHAGVQAKALQTVLSTMLPDFVDQVRRAVLADFMKNKEEGNMKPLR